MGLPVFVGSAFVAQYPTGGGNFWVPLQYLLGLRALGVEAHWLELLWAGGDRRRAQFVGAFRGAVERLGVAEWVTLVCFPESSRDGSPGQAEHHGLAPAELRARARDALLLNLANSLTAPLRTMCSSPLSCPCCSRIAPGAKRRARSRSCTASCSAAVRPAKSPDSAPATMPAPPPDA